LGSVFQCSAQTVTASERKLTLVKVPRDKLAAVYADRVLQTAVVDTPDKRLDARTGVATDQDPPAHICG
jgi:hypothetical protein